MGPIQNRFLSFAWVYIYMWYVCIYVSIQPYMCAKATVIM